jgi:hypothetical protein
VLSSASFGISESGAGTIRDLALALMRGDCCLSVTDDRRFDALGEELGERKEVFLLDVSRMPKELRR